MFLLAGPPCVFSIPFLRPTPSHTALWFRVDTQRIDDDAEQATGPGATSFLQQDLDCIDDGLVSSEQSCW